MLTSRLAALVVAISLALGLVTITLAAAAPSATTTPIPEPYSLVNLSMPQANHPSPPATPDSTTHHGPPPSRWVKPMIFDRDMVAAGPHDPRGFRSHAPTTGGDWDGRGARYPMIIQDGGSYKMWYTGYELQGPQRVGYATSPDGLNWTKDPGNPVLEVGNPGEWDADGVEAPFVIRESPTSYKMWYSGFSGCAIGYATSSDGINWTKYAGNPVLTPGGENWNNNCALHPFVLFEGGVYKMWLLALGDDGNGTAPYMAYATSPDGIVWTWNASNPLFGTDWEVWLWRPDVLHQGGTYQMWYSVWDGAEGVTTYATAPDEGTWTKQGSAVLSGTGGEWDEGNAVDPFVIQNSGVYTMWYDDNTAIGVVTSTNGITWTKFLTGPVLTPGDAGVFIDVNHAHDWVESWTAPDATVVVTVADAGGIKATVAGQADGNGWFGSHQWTWDPTPPDIAPGDIITASSDGPTTTVNPVGTIEGDLDVDSDIFTGTLNAPWFDPLTLTVRCEMWVENGPPPIVVTGVPADGGTFICDFSGTWDVERGQDVAVRYLEPDGDTVINIFRLLPLDIDLRINYAHDWVEGFYEPGHTLWLTLTDSLGDIKATATLTSGAVPWWSNITGFNTDFTVVEGWSPRPDLQEGDWVSVLMDNGYTATARIGTITGELDVGADTVSGTVMASGFTQTLNAGCGVWVSGGPGYNFSIDPNGGSYFCDFTPDWDLVPGNNVGVHYQEPDGDLVINMFRDPTPHLNLGTWADGAPAEGSNFALVVQYWNNGDAPAENVVVTSTLTNATYLTDTTGLSHTGSGSGPLVWNLGDLPAHSTGQFVIFVDVSGASGEFITHTADIATSNPYNEGDPSERTSTWSGAILANDTQLNVGKWAWTWDPLPGYDYVYGINVCNNGTTGSTDVTLTDTLPLSTTLVSWWGQQPGWVEVSSAPDELVVARPSIAGNWCGQVHVRVNLDSNAQAGQALVNTAVILASNDLDPNDNMTVLEHGAGFPRHNLTLDKAWESGQLVPGGQTNYWIYLNNTGNLPVTGTIWITETLPAGTTLVNSQRVDALGQWSPFTPTLVTIDEAVWEINGLDNGYSDSFMVTLQIDNAAQAGTALVNCATISDGQFEDNPYDDTDCVTETVFAPGPNLRATKFYYWQSTGAVGYDVRFENVGTLPINAVSITDTFPAGFSVNYWGLDFWESWTGGVSGNQITATLSHLDPGWRTWLHLGVGFNLPNGTLFTNTAQVMLPPGDTNPADNTSTVVLGTGPDLRIEKTLTAGEPRPGELLTFTLHFENNSAWGTAGSVAITDTLPAGLEFVSAQQRLCGPVYFCDRPPDRTSGNALGWDWNGVDPIGSGWWNDIVVTVRLTDTLAAGTLFTNTAQIASNNPTADVEPNNANNTDTYVVLMILNRLYLPVVRR